MPRSPPAPSVTSRNSALRSSIRISASAAESPRTAVGTESSSDLTGRRGGGQAFDQDPSPQQRIGHHPEMPVPDSDGGARRSAFGHQSRHIGDVVGDVDDQRLGEDQIVDQAVGRDDDPLPGDRGLLGKERGAGPGGEGGFDDRGGNGRHGDPVRRDRQRTDRPA